MTELADALSQLAATRAELHALINSCEPEALERKGAVGDWSAKNVLAHLAAWEAWVVEALPERMRTGATPAHLRERLADEERFNAEEIAEREELTVDEQIIELERYRDELLAWLATLDQAAVSRPQPWGTWLGTLPEYLIEALRDHEAEHIAALRAAFLAG